MKAHVLIEHDDGSVTLIPFEELTTWVVSIDPSGYQLQLTGHASSQFTYDSTPGETVKVIPEVHYRRIEPAQLEEAGRGT